MSTHSPSIRTRLWPPPDSQSTSLTAVPSASEQPGPFALSDCRTIASAANRHSGRRGRGHGRDTRPAATAAAQGLPAPTFSNGPRNGAPKVTVVIPGEKARHVAARRHPVGHLFSCSSTHRPVPSRTLHFMGPFDSGHNRPSSSCHSSAAPPGIWRRNWPPASNLSR